MQIQQSTAPAKQRWQWKQICSGFWLRILCSLVIFSWFAQLVQSWPLVEGSTTWRHSTCTATASPGHSMESWFFFLYINATGYRFDIGMHKSEFSPTGVGRSQEKTWENDQPSDHVGSWWIILFWQILTFDFERSGWSSRWCSMVFPVQAVSSGSLEEVAKAHLPYDERQSHWVSKV